MYKNRSPNTFIIFMILFATSFSIPHSHATTDELEIPDPLTSSFCEKTLNDPMKENFLKKEERIQCEELLELEQISSPESENPLTSETTPPESEEPPTSETTPSESEDPPTSETSLTEEDETTVIEQPKSENKEVVTPSDKINESNNELSKSIKDQEQSNSSSLLDINVIGTSSLFAEYDETNNTITLKNTVSSLLAINTSGFIIFNIPPEIMQSIDSKSIKLQSDQPRLLVGRKIEEIPATIDRTKNQIYAQSDMVLKLLDRSFFTLSFSIGRLPIGVDKTYTFRSVLANGLVDLNVLSSGTATAVLGVGPTFNLKVPNTLDFGSHELTGREKIIPRVSPMTIAISHENATGYNWKLQASLSRPLTSTTGDVLTDVLYFKTASKTQLLQATAIEVATGTMSASSNQTPLTYAENEGIILDLTGKYPKPLSYSADIQWSLVDAP